MRRNYVIGIDEAGRGPLAGPITVAAVAYPSRPPVFKNIKDSKKLSSKKRDEWLLKIKNRPGLISVHSSVGNMIIDKKGISYAARLAVKRCLAKLDSKFMINASVCRILLDGSLFAPAGYRQETVIRGDENIPIIAAASIVAKVTRDRKMARLAKKIPRYFFEVHKGYGTPLHSRLIKKYGVSKAHRRSFCSNLI